LQTTGTGGKHSVIARTALTKRYKMYALADYLWRV